MFEVPAQRSASFAGTSSSVHLERGKKEEEWEWGTKQVYWSITHSSGEMSSDLSLSIFENIASSSSRVMTSSEKNSQNLVQRERAIGERKGKGGSQIKLLSRAPRTTTDISTHAHAQAHTCVATSSGLFRELASVSHRCSIDENDEFIIETRQSGGDVNVREGRSRTSRSRDFRATLVSLLEFDHNVGACDVTCVHRAWRKEKRCITVLWWCKPPWILTTLPFQNDAVHGSNTNSPINLLRTLNSSSGSSAVLGGTDTSTAPAPAGL